MEYRCKQCGSRVIEIVLFSNPPKTRFLCLGCGKELIRDTVLKTETVVVDFEKGEIIRECSDAES